MSEKRRIGIVGAGFAGLSAAYDFLAAGHEVTIFEASDHTGGLAAGFKDEKWDWSLEHFYHHIFETDEAMIGLVEELGLRDKLFFPTPRTSIWHEGKIYPFSNPFDWFRFPGYNIIDFFRFGVVGAFLRYTRFWRWLEQDTAVNWTRRWYGKKIHDISWKPLLIGKFGPYYEQVNMAWLWARLHVRSFSLGYFKGGFATIVNGLTRAVVERGGEVRLSTRVERLERGENGRWHVQITEGETEIFDQVLVTTSPGLLAKLAPDLPEDYLAGLRGLKSMAAVVLVLALNKQLIEETYWLNLPANSADKSKNPIPYLALVEHTNYIDREHYGGDHIVYCGDYVVPEHAYMSMPEAELTALFVESLTQFNPNFKREWIRKSWLFRTPYAQPVPPVKHSENIPALETPLPGLYLASMSQVYPWDRGTNFAVEIGRRVAAEMMEAGNS
ncbi:MAG TPA: NAD(P)/FAD-dependent oxidoreductase [Anaerolineae bacterium]|nr:NAD(P)/FAD-dependent oxidoreductase [Anaerolineae bacterium]